MADQFSRVAKQTRPLPFQPTLSTRKRILSPFENQMSASTYKRATKKYAARVDHIDGDASTGFVLVPVGSDFVTTIAQASGFLNFETDEGEETYLSLHSVKRITELVDANTRQRQENDARAAGEKAKAQAAADNQTTAKAEKADPRDRSSERTSPFTRNEEFEALDILGLGEYATYEEIQGTYRRLVKLYHPDRLRGLGVSDKKIAYAAERLAEINNAYKLLVKVAKAA